MQSGIVTRLTVRFAAVALLASLTLLTVSHLTAISWYDDSNGRHIGIRKGEAFLYWRDGYLPPTSQPGWTMSNQRGHDWPPRWYPRVERDSFLVARIKWIMPLWIPSALSGAILVWRVWGSRKRLGPGFCNQCGYNLTANISGRCPECGTVIK